MSVYGYQSLDNANRVFRNEEVWTYTVFGLASVVGLMVSILILMHQTRSQFGNSEELMEQMIEIARDALEHSSRLSLLYPSPNPGQWNRIFRQHRGFDRLRACLLEHADREQLPTKICMLRGSAADEDTPLGKFIAAFHDVEHTPGEALQVTMRESPLGRYQREAHEFLQSLQNSRTCTITYIADEWYATLAGGWLMMLAAGHSLGFIGYISLEAGKYRFKALPLSGSTAFLHGLYDALSNFYQSPPPTQ
jgi:hypothetical protein